MLDEVEEDAVCGVARNDGGTVFTAGEEGFTGIEIEAGADFLFAVAFHAVVLEEDADVAFEEIDALCHLGGVLGGDGCGE